MRKAALLKIEQLPSKSGRGCITDSCKGRGRGGGGEGRGGERGGGEGGKEERRGGRGDIQKNKQHGYV